MAQERVKRRVRVGRRRCIGDESEENEPGRKFNQADGWSPRNTLNTRKEYHHGLTGRFNKAGFYR
jgi:hypothetical protein